MRTPFLHMPTGFCVGARFPSMMAGWQDWQPYSEATVPCDRHRIRNTDALPFKGAFACRNDKIHHILFQIIHTEELAGNFWIGREAESKA
jgi:hypothetical protein